MSRERTIFHRYDSRCEGMIITVQRRIESSPCDFEKQTIRAEQILLSKQYDGRNVIVTNKVTLRIYYRSKIYMKSESIIISYYQNKCLINNLLKFLTSYFFNELKFVLHFPHINILHLRKYKNISTKKETFLNISIN